MPTRPHSSPLGPDDRELIRRKVYRLVGPGFSREDGRDLEQSLLVHLWKCMPRYALARGRRRAFVASVINNYVATFLGRRSARKRPPPIVRYLSEPATPCDGRPATLSETVERRHQDAARGRHRRLTEAEEVRLMLDVAEVLAELPAELRALAALLMEGETLAGAARRLKIHRATAHRRAKKLAAALGGLASRKI